MKEQIKNEKSEIHDGNKCNVLMYTQMYNEWLLLKYWEKLFNMILNIVTQLGTFGGAGV